MNQNEWIYREFLEEYADRLTEEVMFADDNGIIFASNRANREGFYHEPSCRLAQKNLNLLIITGENGFVGAEDGACTAICLNGKRTAVMTVTGQAAVSARIVQALAVAVEERLRRETGKRRVYKGEEEVKIQFAKGIFFEGYYDDAELLNLAKQMRIRPEWVRIPVICRFPDDCDAAELARVCRKLSGSGLILAEACRDDQLLMLIEAEWKDRELFREYRFMVANEISSFLQFLRQREIAYRLVVGSWQEKITDLPKAVSHCRWLLRKTRDTDRTLWFYDYLDEYFFSCVDHRELGMVFQVPDQVMDQKMKQSFMELFDALIHENFNLDRAALRLHMHKNTIAYRLGKIREILGMNPLVNMRERQFMVKYYLYLKRIREW